VFSHGTVTSAEGLDITVDHGDAVTVVRLRGRLSIESSAGTISEDRDRRSSGSFLH